MAEALTFVDETIPAARNDEKTMSRRYVTASAGERRTISCCTAETASVEAVALNVESLCRSPSLSRWETADKCDITSGSIPSAPSTPEWSGEVASLKASAFELSRAASRPRIRILASALSPAVAFDLAIVERYFNSVVTSAMTAVL
jgi:hypothetical protein